MPPARSCPRALPMRRPAAAALLAVALLAPAAALSQSVGNFSPFNVPYRFETVDAFETKGLPNTNYGSGYSNYVEIVGVLQGQSTPTTLRFSYSLAPPATGSENARTY